MRNLNWLRLFLFTLILTFPILIKADESNCGFIWTYQLIKGECWTYSDGEVQCEPDHWEWVKKWTCGDETFP